MTYRPQQLNGIDADQFKKYNLNNNLIIGTQLQFICNSKQYSCLVLISKLAAFSFDVILAN